MVNNKQFEKENLRKKLENSRKLFDEGSRLLSKRRFTDAFDIFEMASKDDRRNTDIYSKMGICCIYLNYIDEAKKYFTRAIHLDRDNTEAMNGLSFVFLKMDNPAEATGLMCDVLRIEPHNKFAKKNFNQLKNADNIESFIVKIHPGEFVDLPRRFYMTQNVSTSKKLRYLAFGVIIISVLILARNLFIKKPFDIPWRVKERKQRSINPLYTSDIPIKGHIQNRLKQGIDRINQKNQQVFTEQQISKILTRIKQAIESREYNESIFLYNKIKNSNADEMSKSIAEQLRGFIIKPDSKMLRFNPIVSDVIKHPYFYKSVYIKWLSKTVNVKNKNYIQIAPARYHTGADQKTGIIVIGKDIPRINKGRFIEVFGQIIGIDPETKDEKGIIFIKLDKLKKLH